LRVLLAPKPTKHTSSEAKQLGSGTAVKRTVVRKFAVTGTGSPLESNANALEVKVPVGVVSEGSMSGMVPGAKLPNAIGVAPVKGPRSALPPNTVIPTGSTNEEEKSADTKNGRRRVGAVLNLKYVSNKLGIGDWKSSGRYLKATESTDIGNK